MLSYLGFFFHNYSNSPEKQGCLPSFFSPSYVSRKTRIDCAVKTLLTGFTLPSFLYLSRRLTIIPWEYFKQFGIEFSRTKLRRKRVGGNYEVFRILLQHTQSTVCSKIKLHSLFFFQAQCMAAWRKLQSHKEVTVVQMQLHMETVHDLSSLEDAIKVSK